MRPGRSLGIYPLLVELTVAERVGPERGKQDRGTREEKPGGAAAAGVSRGERPRTARTHAAHSAPRPTKIAEPGPAKRQRTEPTMLGGDLQNENPTVYETRSRSVRVASEEVEVDDEESRDEFTREEVFELIRHLNDPEHPLTLEQLRVATLEGVRVDDAKSAIDINFTPTIPHCSMATLIGLCIRVKLIRSLPRRFKVRIKITPGAHASEEEVNKQLNDKERVAAALENANLLGVVSKSIAGTDL